MGFINGLSVQTMAFASQELKKMDTHGGIHGGDIILGSQDVKRSADGVSIGDLVYWNRITLSHEGHRFVGYTGKLQSFCHCQYSKNVKFSQDQFLFSNSGATAVKCRPVLVNRRLYSSRCTVSNRIREEATADDKFQ